MKKVIIQQELHKMLQEKDSFLNRSDIRVFISNSNDETLNIHRAECVSLIITLLDMPGMSSEHLFSLIKKEASLRDVSVLMVCPNNPAAIELSSRCGASAVLLRPVNPALLLAKAQQLLNIHASRETCRVLLKIEGKANVRRNPGNSSFVCRSQDISVSGMLIETDKVLYLGDQVACSLALPNSRKIETTGEIVRAISQERGSAIYQYGVKFIALSADARGALEAFVDENASPQRTVPR